MKINSGNLTLDGKEYRIELIDSPVQKYLNNRVGEMVQADEYFQSINLHRLMALPTENDIYFLLREQSAKSPFETSAMSLLLTGEGFVKDGSLLIPGREKNEIEYCGLINRIAYAKKRFPLERIIDMLPFPLPLKFAGFLMASDERTDAEIVFHRQKALTIRAFLGKIRAAK